MGEFKYVSPDEVAARHRASAPKTPSRQGVSRAPVPQRQPEQRNVEAVLSLGATRYITYRNRTYRIPPVPFKLGQKVLDLNIKILADAKHVALTGQDAAAQSFYKKMDQMARVLWTHVQPIGKFSRMLWRLGLKRNPFRQASEAEMKAIIDFFLQGRMTSSVRSMSDQEVQA